MTHLWTWGPAADELRKKYSELNGTVVVCRRCGVGRIVYRGGPRKGWITFYVRDGLEQRGGAAPSCVMLDDKTPNKRTVTNDRLVRNEAGQLVEDDWVPEEDWP